MSWSRVWSSDVSSSDLGQRPLARRVPGHRPRPLSVEPAFDGEQIAAEVGDRELSAPAVVAQLGHRSFSAGGRAQIGRASCTVLLLWSIVGLLWCLLM